MAAAEEIKVKVSVSVEKAIHDALRDMAEKVLKEHGICIKDVSFDWIDTSTISESRMNVARIEMQTSAKYMG